MSDAVAGALLGGGFGLLGVVVGGFLNAYATTRSARRSGARTAGLLALDGLDRWLEAIHYLEQAPTRHAERADDYDAYVAIELTALRRHLSAEWWQQSRADLLVVATEQEAETLSAAGRASEGLLVLLEQIGDAGRQALRKRAAVRREVAEKRAAAEKAAAAPTATEPVDSELAAEDRELAEFDAFVREFEADMQTFDVETTQLLGDLRSILDHRLWAVRQVTKDVTGARAKFEDAVESCRMIIRRNGGDAVLSVRSREDISAAAAVPIGPAAAPQEPGVAPEATNAPSGARR